jgi:hypothetical protein
MARKQMEITVDGASILETVAGVAREFRGTMHGAREVRRTLVEQAREVARGAQAVGELPPGAQRERCRQAAEARLDALRATWPQGWRRLVDAALRERAAMSPAMRRAVDA